MVEWKQTVKSDFFEKKLLLQPDVVFNSESNGRNYSCLALPGGEKKLFSIFKNLKKGPRLKSSDVILLRKIESII